MSAENPDDISDFDTHSVAQSEASTSKSELEFDKYGFFGGKEYTNPEKAQELPVEKVRIRERKWLAMLANWDKLVSKHNVKVKKRCRKGIPSSLRGRVWQNLCGSKYLQSQDENRFQKLLQSQPDEQIVEVIEKDLHRQFPFHEMFLEKNGNGQQDLRNVLYAYVIHNPKDGYCQAQAPVAAVLLMHMPAEEAFWCMVAIFDCYIPGYYSPGLEAVQVDGDIVQGLLRLVSSVAYKHLERLSMSPMLYCMEWLMCIFSRTLPWPCVLRLWDIFLCEGIKILFRCALIILKNALGQVQVIRTLPTLYETGQFLKKFDMSKWSPSFLVKEITDLRIEEDDLEKEYKRQVKIRLKNNSQAVTIKRQFKLVLNHTSKKAYSMPTPMLARKKLSTVSVNSPQANKAVELEQKRKSERKRLHSKQKKGDLPEVYLTDYKRKEEIDFGTINSNGDVASTSASDVSIKTPHNAKDISVTR